jgi:hypothetical protein
MVDPLLLDDPETDFGMIADSYSDPQTDIPNRLKTRRQS